MTAARKRTSRATRRSRVLERVRVPIPSKLKDADPLVHTRRSNAGALVAAVFVASAIMLHGVVLGAFFAAGAVVSRFSVKNEVVDDRIEVAVVEPPPPPPPPPPAPPPEVEETQEPEQKPKPKPEVVKPPPPDPIDIPKEPPPPAPEPKKAPRRIVGLNLESTVEGGSGPGFAVGNTRMGKTAEKAEDPTEAKPLPKPQKKEIPPPANRAATRIPTKREVKLVKPKPIGGMKTPPFPELYKAQGLEADVTVRVRIDATGKVTEVEIVAPSKHPEFNENAKKTARAQRFSPATRDGEPIEYTITFTYRFRLVD